MADEAGNALATSGEDQLETSQAEHQPESSKQVLTGQSLNSKPSPKRRAGDDGDDHDW